MTYYYRDAINDHLLDAAAGDLMRFAARCREESLQDLAERIVDGLFCQCVITIPDAMEGHRSAIHAAVVDEVLARTRRIQQKPGTVDLAGKRLDDTSDQSFPASDPPSWIYAH